MKDVDKKKVVSVDSEITFNKQRVRKVSLFRGDKDILSGEVELSSDEHEVKKRENISIDISEVPMNVQGVINGIETFTGNEINLKNLTVSDFINSIVHEAISQKDNK